MKAPPTEHRFYPRKQFTRVAALIQEVIGAGFKPADPVRIAAPDRADDDRQGIRPLGKSSAQREAVFSRNYEVLQQYEIGRPLPKDTRDVISAFSNIYGKAMLL